MSRVRQLLLTPVRPGLTPAAVVSRVMTAAGVFTFVAGTLYLPSLNPTQIEAIVVLLLLGILAVSCAAFGQLAILVERIAQQDRPQP